MQLRVINSILIFCHLLCNITLHAQSPHATAVNWKADGATIILKDGLKHPSIAWPYSTLQYSIDFGAKGVLQNELVLTEETAGRTIPFQLNDAEIKNGRIQKAILTFSSDLPSGMNKIFRLTPAKGKGTAEFTDVVKVTRTADAYLVSNGKIRLEVPLSGSKAVAPIKRYGNAAKWLGIGEMPVTLSLVKMTVTELSTGPVQAEYRIAYEFAGNRRYTALVKLAAGMEFAELEEQMAGFAPKNNLAWRMIWNGITPEYRYSSTRADKKDTRVNGYDNVVWEPMNGLPVNPASEKHPEMSYDQENAKDGRLPFSIVPYDNWMTWWRLPVAAFWNEKENTSIGLFIKEIERWNDSLYALWGSKMDLSISFHWINNTLDYTFPLTKGTRSTGIAAYEHKKDIDQVNNSKNTLVYIDELRRWYGWLSLDKTKNWILDYEAPETGYPRYFKPENAPANFTVPALDGSLSNCLKGIASGTERMSGPSPVGSRVFYDNIGPSFDLNAGKMNPEQYKRLRAWFTFLGYVYMDETLMPMQTMLSGHPNFLADVKGVTGLTAFLFPRHPEAKKFSDHFDKFVQLNYNYHVRPEVKDWDAQGGRWTENLATYTWAALKPTIRTSYLLHHNYDGKNRFLQPGVSMYGNWLLNAITVPLTANKNRRVYPPQGAHAHAYGEGPPNALRLLAQELNYYDPLLSENIFWFTNAEDSPFESNKDKDKAWREMLKGAWENNKGTNPHLRSSKFTGYGFVLRSKFATKDEMFVNLQQIDEGPNYRWGRAGMGGNGVIYYYAQGKRYSHNGSEDVGDGPFGDVERSTNFGVKKTGGYRALGPYRSVQKNDLTEPLYDFDFAQFATVKGGKEIAKNYRSRSVLQSGADYIAILDDVTHPDTEGRLSWFVGTEDDFPAIHQLVPGAEFKAADISSSKSSYHKDPEVLPTKGRYYDGKGSFFTIVTHKPEIKVNKEAFGATVIKSDGSTDLVFRSAQNIQYSKNGISFSGSAGIVQKNSNDYSAALFAGSEIEVPGLKIGLAAGSNAAASLQTTASGFSGKFQGSDAQQVSFTTTKQKLVFYLDGVAVPAQTDSTIKLNIPAGRHTWQWSSNGVIPEATVITGAVVRNSGATITWKAIPGAKSYILQLSRNDGADWSLVKDNIAATTETLSGLTNGSKVHVRVVGNGPGGNSEPCNEYPVYITDKAPHAPEGLRLDLNSNQAKITWGKVLGAGSYQLYRKTKDSKAAFERIYTGKENMFMDSKPGKGVIYEYAVAAVNGNGESIHSNIIDTDPSSLLNWEPMKGEGFRRDTGDHENGFTEYNPFVEDKLPVLNYPREKNKK